jgi:hypothetical protein
MQQNNYPKLHNATWPGIVGTGPDSEPPISLDDLLNFTANAEVDGVKFDGIDIGLFEPHFNIDESDDGKHIMQEQDWGDDDFIACFFADIFFIRTAKPNGEGVSFGMWR